MTCDALPMIEFSFDLLSSCNLATDNVLISPLSVYNVLLLVLYGAGGSTRTQIRKALRCKTNTSVSARITDEEYDVSTLPFRAISAREAVKIYTSFLYKESLPISKYLLEKTEHIFSCESRSFGAANEAVRREINQIIKDRTQDKIENFIKQLSPDTGIIILSIMSFKGLWATPFTARVERTFENADGSTIVTQFLTQRNRFEVNILPDAGFVVFLPYKDSHLTMSLFLPRMDYYNKNDKSFRNMLTNISFKALLKPNANVTVTLVLPKFNIFSDTDLKNPLQAMGITDAFRRDTADFSAFMEDHQKVPGLSIDRFAHRASVEIDETGTRAVAGTSAVFKTRSAGLMKFTFNRPFLFIIHDRASEIPLFMGVVNKL